jgi:hypothetical protein
MTDLPQGTLPPRSDETVKRLATPALTRARRLRAAGTLIMLAPGIVGGALIALQLGPADSRIGTGIVVLLCLGVLPAAAVRWYFSAQMKVAPKLVRIGVAVTGRIVRLLDGGGAKYFTLVWTADDGREHLAKLKATNVKEQIHEGYDVTIFVSPQVRSQVGVVLGENGFYVADGR